MYDSRETCPVLCWEITDVIVYLILLYRFAPSDFLPKTRDSFSNSSGLVWHNSGVQRNHIDKGDKK